MSDQVSKSSRTTLTLKHFLLGSPYGRLLLAALMLVAVWRVAAFGSHDGGTPDYVLPAEWEPHDAVWLSFFGGPTDSVSYEIAASVSAHTNVRAAVSTDGALGSAAVYRLRTTLDEMGADLSRIDIVRTDRNVQVRDTGPIFVRDQDGRLRIVDFAWNNYGTAHGRPDAYPFDAMMAEDLGIPVVKSNLVMEGGAIESNGAGTVLQVESVTLQRNPGMTKRQIEAELRRVVGAERVVWLEQGPVEDSYGLTRIGKDYVAAGIGGHVDEFARFVDERTVLLAFPDAAQAASDPIMRLNLERMQRNYERLLAARDQDGEPLKIVKVPMPNPPYEELVVDSSWRGTAFEALLERHPDLSPGDTMKWVPARSYLNFFVTNGTVFAPRYWKPGLPHEVRHADERFAQVLRRFYPDREIVLLDPRDLNDNLGGIHCWTQQQPTAADHPA